MRLGRPEAEAEMKPPDIYSSVADVPLLSGSALSLPPLPRAGWAQCRHPQMRQKPHFSCSYIYLRKPLCHVLAIIKDFGSIVEAEISFKVKIEGPDCFKE